MKKQYKRMNIVSTENYFEKVEPTITETQQRILNLFNGQPLTLEQIAIELKTLPHKISGRITDLIDLHKIERFERVTNSFGNTCWNYIKVSETPKQLSLI